MNISGVVDIAAGGPFSIILKGIGHSFHFYICYKFQLFANCGPKKTGKCLAAVTVRLDWVKAP